MIRHQGFTLVELITVIILVGIMAVVVLPRFGSSDSMRVLAARDDLVSAINFARMRAMSVDDGSADNTIRLVISTAAISVTQNGAAMHIGAVNYPVSYSNISFSPTGTVTFDRLGQVSASSISGLNQTTISLSAGDTSADVIFQVTGHAR